MKKISKQEARKRFLSFLPFVICASKLNPYWLGVHIDEHDYGMWESFEQMVNSFRYYNCLDNETGRGVKFYIEE